METLSNIDKRAISNAIKILVKTQTVCNAQSYYHFPFQAYVFARLKARTDLRMI
jgi:hypothetical protein